MTKEKTDSMSKKIKEYFSYEMDAATCTTKDLVKYYECPPRLSTDKMAAKAVGCSEGLVSTARKRFKIPRMVIRGNLIIENFCNKLLGYDYQVYMLKKREKKRTIIAFCAGAGVALLLAAIGYAILT